MFVNVVRRFVLVGLCLCGVSMGQVTTLYSFEGAGAGDVEGWGVGFDGSCATDCSVDLSSTTGVTDGSFSMQVTDTGGGFAWSSEVQIPFGSDQYNAIDAAAASPFGNRLEFDVTWTDTSIPSPFEFLGISVYINNSGGFAQADNAVVQGDPSSGTFTGSVPLVRFSSEISSGGANTFYNMGFGTNGAWGAGDASFFFDNIRLVAFNPAESADLDLDGDLDPDDWTLFIAGHKTDLTGLSPMEQFQMGDLNADGQNNFTDFQLFEEVYDVVNGANAFRDMLYNVPEPSSLVLFGIAAVALLGFRKRANIAILLVATAVILQFGSVSEAQLLNSWETGLEDWNVTTFTARPTTIATGTIGATEGSSSLAITQEGDGFNWAVQVNYGSDSPAADIFRNAIQTGLENFDLEFDVTYDTSVVPQTGSFLNMSVALNSSAGWSQVDSLAFSSGTATETVPVFIPMDSFDIAVDSGFYQINFGLNGDWGVDPATIHVDNLRVTQLFTPSTLTLEVDRSTGGTRILNDGAGLSFDFDYYEITSSGNSLDPANWNSLDAQNIDAVDGADPGTIAGDSVLEGWDAAGGASASDLSEAFLLGSSRLANNQSFDLGQAYQNRINAEDIEFRYRDVSRPDVLTLGEVVYIGEPPLVTGDFDNDGDYSCADVDLMVAEIAAGTNSAGFDLTGDGAVDGADLTAWLAEAGAAELPSGNPYQLGDANLDGVVDVSDFNVWNAAKFTSNAAWC